VAESERMEKIQKLKIVFLFSFVSTEIYQVPSKLKTLNFVRTPGVNGIKTFFSVKDSRGKCASVFVPDN
jgi:hypothetical protein